MNTEPEMQDENTGGYEPPMVVVLGSVPEDTLGQPQGKKADLSIDFP